MSSLYGLALPPPPPLRSPVSKSSLFLSLPVCRRSSLLTGEVRGDGVGSKIIRRRENLVLYILFNTIWAGSNRWGKTLIKQNTIIQHQLLFNRTRHDVFGSTLPKQNTGHAELLRQCCDNCFNGFNWFLMVVLLFYLGYSILTRFTGFTV